MVEAFYMWLVLQMGNLDSLQVGVICLDLESLYPQCLQKKHTFLSSCSRNPLLAFLIIFILLCRKGFMLCVPACEKRPKL